MRLSRSFVEFELSWGKDKLTLNKEEIGLFLTFDFGLFGVIFLLLEARMGYFWVWGGVRNCFRVYSCN